MPSFGVEPAQHLLVPSQQARPGAQDPRLLEVLAIGQAALQVLELPPHRQRPALEPVVPAATDDVAGDAGHEDEGNHQRQRRGERMEIDPRRRKQHQHADRAQERHQHPQRSPRPRFRQLDALVRIQRLEVDDLKPRSLAADGSGEHADGLSRNVRVSQIRCHLQELPRQDHDPGGDDRAGDRVPPCAGQPSQDPLQPVVHQQLHADEGRLNHHQGQQRERCHAADQPRHPGEEPEVRRAAIPLHTSASAP